MKKNRLFGFCLVVFIGILFSSCFTVPEYRGVSDFKLEEFKNKNLLFSLNIDIYNPNNYGIRVKKSKMGVYINENYIGEAKLLKSFKMKRKSSTSCLLPINLELEQGAIFKLIPILNVRRGANIRVDGILKAKALLIPKREEINQEVKVNLRDLGVDFKNILK